jgi:hypothetical protein
MAKIYALFSFIVCFFFVAEKIHSQTIVNVYQLPNATYWNQTYGIANDSNHLFITSSTSTTSIPNYGYIYTLDMNGTIADSGATSLGSSQGLAFDGTNFFYIRRYTATCSIIKITKTGTVIDSLRFSSKYIGGVTWDGTHVWISDYYPSSGMLYKINWNTKSIVDSFSTIGAQPTGLAFDGSYIYYAMDRFSAEPNLNLIYVVNPTNGDTVRTIQMPDNNPLGDINPRGMTIAGRFLWLVAKSLWYPTRQALYQYDLSGSGTPAINLPVKNFNVGNVAIGTTGEVNGTIQNLGLGNLVLDSIQQLFSTSFSTNIQTPQTITPGNSINFTLSFAPQSFEPDSAYFLLHNNDIVRGTQTIKMFGTGISAFGFINVPDSFHYGARRINSSTKWNLKIHNAANDELIVDSAAMLSFMGEFYFQNVLFPFTVPPLSSVYMRVWYHPTNAGTHTAILRLYNNSTNAPEADIALSGIGEPQNLAIAVPFWSHTIVDHPISNTFRLVKAVRAINDISGDGKPEIIVSTENYWTMALNGNGSGETDSLWAFTTYIHNASAGSIGTASDYSHQKALEVTSDLNNDGFQDVVIGTGEGNEHVYAIDGKNGRMIWTYGTDHPDSFSMGDFTGVDAKRDFTGDGIPDVVAASSATDVGGVGGRRSAFLFNGQTGELLWTAPLDGFTHGIISIGDIDNDAIPDVVGTVGEPTYKAFCFSGANGAVKWSFSPSATGSAKEVLEFPVAGQTPDVILGAFWGPIFRLDGVTGAQMWSRGTNNHGVMQLVRLRDVTNDGVDEILAALLTGGAMCINGANGNIVWHNFPSENTMGCASISDLNGDGIDEAIFAVQNVGTYILRGDNGQQLALYPATTTAQSREVAVVPDLDGNNSKEIIIGGKIGNVTLLSGGLDAPQLIRLEQSIPKEFSLGNNYPNPFNPSTSFRLNIAKISDVEISIYNILGEHIQSFSYENLSAGSHEITWDGKNLSGEIVASGVYLLRVNIRDDAKELFTATKRLMMVK